jgi:hypothetical protein
MADLIAASIIRAKMEAVITSETSVNFYHTTRRNNPTDSHLLILYILTNQHHCSVPSIGFEILTAVLRVVAPCSLGGDKAP